MLTEALFPGIEFVKKFEITGQELIILSPFLQKNYSCSEVTDLLALNKMTVYGLISRLRIKKILEVKEKQPKGVVVYGFNHSILE